MVKQIILISLLSIATIMFREHLAYSLDYVVFLHNRIAEALHLVFADDNVGRLIQDMIALLFIPVVCGLLLASMFWLVKRTKMPHVMTVIWVVWLVLLVTMLAQNPTQNSNASRPLAQSSHHKVIKPVVRQ